MDPVDKAVAFCMSEKPADPFLSAIARNILSLVLRARSWVSPINIDIAQINYLFFTKLIKFIIKVIRNVIQKINNFIFIVIQLSF